MACLDLGSMAKGRTRSQIPTNRLEIRKSLVYDYRDNKEGEIQEVLQAAPKTPKRIAALDMEDDPRWKDIKD